ncbi:Dipeptidyl aminopeptidase/acylaminoacyl peptidase [Sphingomonas laterariae]|uniref:Dipeptidyl aminopeptidase/acylaminoacyl peptidase n=1 Tax=Edaphosphingomonas laterariae TaxID=861865 RepID=A0A239DLU5_9SPHN|nr:S9 family peptidase [Sphingomonas laterariae]SNS32808.1 Dipeptidyl aminopeptidase/acylaminoacyl peptidase [Sphingomonas laterariae]
MSHRTIALLFAAATAIAAPGSLPAAPAEGPSRVLQGADLFSLEVAADPQIRPDGAMIAYVRRSNDVMTDKARATIWLIDTRTGVQTPLVAGPGSHSQPRWSADGKKLAYVSTADGGGAQLYVRWMDNGATARVTGLPDSPSSIAWSPDGRQIAYVMTVPDEGMKLGTAPAKPEGAKWAPPLEIISSIVYRADGAGYLKPGHDHLFVVAADGGAPHQLTFGRFNDNGPLSWTPDGGTILFSADRSENWEREPNNSEIHAVDVATGALTALTSRLGPDAAPAVSPDGKRIAYLGFDDKYRGYENAMVYVMDRDGGNARAISASLDRSVDDVRWAADGRSLYIQYDDHGASRVARIGLDGKLSSVATGLAGTQLDRPYSGGAFSVAKNGAVAFTSGDPQRPADISIAQGSKARQLTRLNDVLLGGKTLGAVRHLPVKAADGRAVDAWLVLPPNANPAKKYPLILEIHGGPFAAYGPAFATDNQLYAAAGYAVLYVNPRGSTSYGAEFANLIHHAYPGDDYGDLMAAVDTAIGTGSIDPDNLFVTGGSGGGVLTAWIVGKTDRFKAAATQKPVIDWTSFVLTADNTPFFAKYWFGKMPWEDPQGYWARSPLSLVGNVKTPTLVVVGSEDYRTPVSESEQYYSALQLRGVPTALVKVPEASHGGIAARPSQSAAKASAIIAWFDKYRNAAK